MPSKTPAQKRLMAAAAHTPGGYGGVPQSVGKEFNMADKRKKYEDGGPVDTSPKPEEKPEEQNAPPPGAPGNPGPGPWTHQIKGGRKYNKGGPVCTPSTEQAFENNLLENAASGYRKGGSVGKPKWRKW